MDFAINCYSEIFVVFLLDFRQMLEMVYISSHSSGVQRYVLHSCIDDHLIDSFSSRLFQWFRLIVRNRPDEDKDYVGGLEDINGVRNGIFATSAIHRSFDTRKLVILKVCVILLFP